MPRKGRAFPVLSKDYGAGFPPRANGCGGFQPSPPGADQDLFGGKLPRCLKTSHGCHAECSRGRDSPRDDGFDLFNGTFELLELCGEIFPADVVQHEEGRYLGAVIDWPGA